MTKHRPGDFRNCNWYQTGSGKTYTMEGVLPTTNTSSTTNNNTNNNIATCSSSSSSSDLTSDINAIDEFKAAGAGAGAGVLYRALEHMLRIAEQTNAGSGSGAGHDAGSSAAGDDAASSVSNDSVSLSASVSVGVNGNGNGNGAGSSRVSLSVSMLEVYNETVRDLLKGISASESSVPAPAKGTTSMGIRQSRSGSGHFVSGLEQVPVRSMEQVGEWVSRQSGRKCQLLRGRTLSCVCLCRDSLALSGGRVMFSYTSLTPPLSPSLPLFSLFRSLMRCALLCCLLCAVLHRVSFHHANDARRCVRWSVRAKPPARRLATP